MRFADVPSWTVLPIMMLLILLPRGAVWAQQEVSAGKEEHAWPINPSTFPRPTHPVTRTSEPIRIDGHLDEAAWAAAPVMTQFIQSRPNLGYPATEATEVRVLYDSEAFYISCVCFDSQPDNIIVSSLERDFPPLDSDVFSFVLNPNMDRLNAFLFYVNPWGAIGDAQAFDDNRILNYAWDAVVEVATQITDFGWIVEMAVPWTTLRFDGNMANQDWGFNVQRRIRRINESSTWSPLEAREFQPKVSRAGTLTGFEDLNQGRNLRVTPYVRSSMGLGSAPNTGREIEVDGGVDLKFGVSSDLILDVTYRTDFSHVEVDAVQVNLTQFPLFFPERRDFFVENSGIFEFGDNTRREFRFGVSERDFTLFQSRRIGLTRGGQVIPVFGGTRLSGSLAQFELGVLGMRTEAHDAGPEENFGVLRLRRVVGNSSIGAMLTHRSFVGDDGDAVYNRSYGADGAVTLLDHLLLTSYIVVTDASDVSGEAGDRSAFRVSAGWRDQLWNSSVLYRRFGSNFRPGLGFVRRRGMDHSYFTFGVHPAVNRFNLQEINPFIDFEVYTNIALGRMETRSARGGLSFLFDDGARASLSYDRTFERLAQPLGVASSGLIIEPGDYEMQRVSLSHTTNAARVVSGNITFSDGGYFGGTRRSIGGGGTWRPSPRVAIGITLERNQIKVLGEELKADIGAIEFNLNPSARLQTRGIVQYSRLTGELATNVRMRLIHAPLSDIFLVYAGRRDVSGELVSEETLTLKVTRLWAF